MSSLYELKTDYGKLLHMLYDGDIDEQTIIDTLDSIEGAIEDKADGYAYIIRELDGDIQSIKAEEERLAKRRKVLTNHKERLRNNLFGAMKEMGKTEIKTSLNTFTIRKNGGMRQLVIDCDINNLPPQFLTTTISSNGAAIREYLTAIKLDGVEGLFHLAPQGESLRIK